MKTNSILLLLAIVWPLLTQAQSLSNLDFETWQTPQGAPFENPTGWTTSNDVIGGFGIVNTNKSTEAQSGQFAAQLESVDVFGMSTAPGFVGFVNIDPLDQRITPGLAYSQRPDSIAGFYRYAPSQGDSMLVLAVFTKWNGTNRDTVGATFYTDGNAVPSYQRFVVPVFYFSNETPDSLLFIIASSNNLDNAVPGSVLLIDNVSFITNTNVNVENIKTQETLAFYPNPARQQLFFSGANKPVLLEIFHINGQLVKKQLLTEFSGVISLDGLTNGIYFVRCEQKVRKIVVAN